MNVGCADDPLQFQNLAHHVDIDDWSYKHKFFTQADIHNLPFADGSQDLVICADVLEHVLYPEVAVRECARIVAPGGRLVFTVFEEWKLPGHGQWIQESHELSDKESQRQGFANREAFQEITYPERKGVSDDEISHLAHINQFNDEDMRILIKGVEALGFYVIEYNKAYEQTYDEHDWYNWLIAFERSSS